MQYLEQIVQIRIERKYFSQLSRCPGQPTSQLDLSQPLSQQTSLHYLLKVLNRRNSIIKLE